jgi:uncharacterized protein (TIGR00304 family)
MNKLHFYSFICFVIGIIFFCLGLLYGDTSAGIFIIFPYISGSGVYSLIGILFIFLSILVFFFGFSFKFDKNDIDNNNSKSEITKKISIKGGGVVLLGPIPIVFGSNWKITFLLIIFAIIIILISIFIFQLF